ncbi:MAG TPA: GNAT family N-acetyltransferase [Candidatus Paceibacterota bacterium]
MSIRNLTLSDVPEIIEIFKFHNQSEGWNESLERFTHELHESLNSQEFTKPYYVVYENEQGSILGFGAYSNTGFDDGVYGLFWGIVHPEHQGKGIGKALTEERIQRIKQAGAHIILSTTKKTWHLERFGFKVIESRDDGYYLMMKTLKHFE